MRLGSKTGAAALSVVSNTVLTLAKLSVGLSIGSVSVVAEAMHSGMDLLASVIAFLSVRASSRPPDEDYPYGRGKIENVSGVAEAILIFLAACIIVFEAAGKLIHGTEPPRVELGLVVMATSIVANVAVSRQLLKVARETDSAALEADAAHLTTDVLTSVGVLVGLLAVRVTGLSFPDPLAALVVAAIIARTAWSITSKSLMELLDRSLPEAERQAVDRVLWRYVGRVVGFHRVRTRKAGAERHVDLHVVVSASSPVSEVHSLCDRIEEDLRTTLPNCSTVIHFEPCRHQCDECAVKCSAGTATSEEQRAA